MAIRHEIKSQLARLLATEDLIVEHKSCETAQFNVHSRVLTLPMWERASGVVYDMLVGHEVGHALFTPDEDWKKNHPTLPHQYVNIVEDIRIEKLMKRKYPGLTKSFYRGYKELSDDDFFSIEDEDVNTFTLPDRINLQAKIGNFIEIEFTDKEKELYALCESCVTFADVLLASEELYKFAKDEQEQQTTKVPVPTGGSGDSEEKGDDTEETEQVESSGESQSGGGSPVSESEDGVDQQQPSTPDITGGKHNNNKEPDIRTVDQLEEKIRDLASSGGIESAYFQVPNDIDMDRVIISNKEIHDSCDSYYQSCQEREDEYTKEHGRNSYPLYQIVDKAYQEFKNSAKREVGYLVKEFECKKSADAYARATTARTGVLDCTKLHTYKYNEDLFRKVTVVPDGKNHGLIFILDWSGSMSSVLLDTIKQLYNLIWFCKKVSIPFEVYAFTNDYHRSVFNPVTGRYDVINHEPMNEEIQGDVVIDSCFSLLNFFTSDVNAKTLEKQMINIWRIASYFSRASRGYDIPPKLSLSGTPLNESLVCLHKIIPAFQKKNKVQKVQAIVLTDGEAPPVGFWDEQSYRSYGREEGKLYPTTIHGGRCVLRDRKLGTTYNVDYGYTSLTDTLLRNLRDKFANVNFIGIRLVPGREANRWIDTQCEYNDYTTRMKLKEEFKKQKSCMITTSGYHAYFGLSSVTLSQETDFEVDEGATKAKIKSAFIKSLKTKKLNKKVLGEFISLVA